MKLLLVAVNAKHIHSNLALRYLENLTKDICDTKLVEYSINDNIMAVERDIILSKPDVIAFSSYIWNIQFILNVSSDLKKALPNIKIILGGPEVSYDAAQILDKHEYIDYIVKGEGEITFPKLVGYLSDKNPMPDCGVAMRDGDKIIDAPYSPLPDFSQIPFPYNDSNIKEFDGKIIYYETSRGCPNSCAYCDWSNMKSKIRKFPLERIYGEIEWMMNNKICGLGAADSNFGLFERDEEIADKIIEAKKKGGYPLGFETSYETNSSKTILFFFTLIEESDSMKDKKIYYQ